MLTLAFAQQQRSLISTFFLMHARFMQAMAAPCLPVADPTYDASMVSLLFFCIPRDERRRACMVSLSQAVTSKPCGWLKLELELHMTLQGQCRSSVQTRLKCICYMNPITPPVLAV